MLAAFHSAVKLRCEAQKGQCLQTAGDTKRRLTASHGVGPRGLFKDAHACLSNSWTANSNHIGADATQTLGRLACRRAWLIRI